MLVYKKYIAKTILYPFLASTFILLGLVWVSQLLKLLYLIDRGVSFTDFTWLTILILPSLFYMIAPLVSVVSVIYIYNRLQEDRELIVLKASGLNNFAIAKPALLFALWVTLISYCISLYLVPVSYTKLKAELSEFRENYISSIIDERTFSQMSRNITIYIDKKNPDSSLEGIILFDNTLPKNHAVLFAKSGRIVMRNNILLLQLKDGFRQSFDERANLIKLYFDRLTVEVKNNSVDTQNRDRTSLELFIHEMIWPEDALSQHRKTRLIIDGHQRLIWPAFNYCLVFLALSVFLNRPYNRKNYFKQMVYVFTPVIITTYTHFTLQKIAYQEPAYIYGCYLNILGCLLFSTWHSNRRAI